MERGASGRNWFRDFRLRAASPWQKKAATWRSSLWNAPSSPQRRLNSGLNARDQAACTAKAALNGRETEHV